MFECLSGRECHVKKDPEAGNKDPEECHVNKDPDVDPEWSGGSGALAMRELASDQARVGGRAGPQNVR